MNKKLEMHAMVDAIENDFINNLLEHITIQNIPKDIMSKIIERTPDDGLKTKLSYLDLHDYINIINQNINIFLFSKEEKIFLNKEISSLISIRNRVMHPRPLEFNDYPILKYTFEQIPEKIIKFKWNNILKTKDIINNRPEELLLMKFKFNKKSSNVYENLPIPEFDDTSYIGRHKEKAEIKKLILNSRRNVITIKGEGGNGKTATVLKVLYELLDDPKSKFDAIIWVTLKTEHLTEVEFCKIENAITDFKKMSEFLAESMIKEDNTSYIDNIIKFAKAFNTLLVIDNLETLNTNDVRDFIYDFSEYGKILITSRVGLGELETRYTLETMNENDSVDYFNAILDYYNLSNFFTNEEKKNIATKELYCNPLAIKWFTRSLYGGIDVKTILENRSDVVSFCMSNVYEKLSILEQNILSTCIVEDKPLSYSTLMFLLGMDIEKEQDIRKAILKLDTSNFLDSNSLKDGVVYLTPLSKSFLRVKCFPNQEFRNLIVQNRKKLSDLMQEMEVKNIRDKYNPRSLMYFKDRDYLISGWYLIQALNASGKGDWDNAFILVENAKKISPKYFETYKISAFLLATKKNNRAYSEYEISYKLCENDEQRATILLLWADYVLSLENRDDALELIEMAEKFDNYSYHIKLEKVKILTYMGKYENAQSILNIISIDELPTLKYKNIYLTRFSDTYKRRAESIEPKYYNGRFPLLKKALEKLSESPQPDYQLTNLKIDLLFHIFFYYYEEEAFNLFINTVKTYKDELFNSRKIQRLISLVNSKISLIDDTNKTEELMKYFTNYNTLSETLLEKNKGYITFIKNNYGFLRNAHYNKGLYFSISNTDKYKIGDLVKFEIVNRPIGIAARIIEVCKK